MGVRIWRCNRCGYLEVLPIIEEIPMIAIPDKIISTDKYGDKYEDLCINCIKKLEEQNEKKIKGE